MAYDEELAGRIRELVSGESGLTEQKMFGGLAFLIGGNMAVAASGQGGILIHVDKAESEELVASTSAYPMEMRGREMQGWLRVDAEDVSGKSELAEWVSRLPDVAQQTQGVHVVHNNCHANYGTTNADEITEMLIEADELRRTMYRERLVLR